MAKKPLSWHKECLENARHHLSRLRSAAWLAQDAYEQAKARVEELEAQVARAEREGKEAFDAERYAPARKGS